MAYDIMAIDDGVVRIRISDRMRLADQKALQDLARELIRKGKPVRLLAILDKFRGWERSEGWNDVGFLAEHGNKIVKMAIVGDECWNEEVFLIHRKRIQIHRDRVLSPVFTGKGRALGANMTASSKAAAAFINLLWY